ncbi:flagellar biosynthesis protein FliQ [Moellerella wisconsensis]|uniref:Flagellar biosynthetic protein FliQ n=3 Tax=Moellerella wisconsensis TaxID=158849 RepID=A0A0N0Z7M4_9GAMM|nr:flagellar biosynthesis protein FliQ [Moellerella wisconsensis]KLN96291.1 flagellar biosynthesis protein FliQ [Moellerella wisconsensis]KPD02329.1 FliQ family flagellar biosynthesis protein [Moellerella wisconsensis ATCC 35017]UNH25225.1 flagellar biosynthesis protein FliQ [Moellerella wisconsensis]UNH28389.1 flagellar biosynthesis protein FliQ [Moellerella wisconsensis]UNH31874.1 flagellar biosynthesis protein FliQ [Moellerella wisconsensis]
MTPEFIVGLGIGAMKVALILGGPLLLAALLSGLIISILQAATQINEMTLSFIPKIICVFGIAILLGPWMLDYVLDYIQQLYSQIPNVIN